MNLLEIQQNLAKLNIDGWLFCDFRNHDKIATRILNMDENRRNTRRWFYFIPAIGQPIKLIHKVKKDYLSELQGRTILYAGWEELHNKLREILKDYKTICMQYSPYNNIPTVSYVDAGMLELIKSFGLNIISSANLVQLFEAKVDANGMKSHKRAGEKIQKIKNAAFELISKSLKEYKQITEYDVQKFILDEFQKENLTCGNGLPIVAVNEHAADPHFEPRLDNCAIIRPGDRVLIDLWARENVPEGIYYDITWCGYVGTNPTKEYVKLFDIIVRARNLAKNFIIDKLGKGEIICGWEIDKVCRDYITQEGYGEYFIHRTGHSIHKEVHGNGVNIDNFETKDDREIIPGICFSIEPGIYKDDIGVRTEINILVNENKNVLVFGDEQQELVLI